jgi:hypothetical protein
VIEISLVSISDPATTAFFQFSIMGNSFILHGVLYHIDYLTFVHVSLIVKYFNVHI